MSPSISIITFARKGQDEFLRLCEQCIMSQTYKSICEWIIVGDVQNTITYERVRYDQKTKQNDDSNSIASSIEVEAQGDLVAYMHADCYYPPQFIENAVKSLKASCDTLSYRTIFTYDLAWSLLVQRESETIILRRKNGKKASAYIDASCVHFTQNSRDVLGALFGNNGVCKKTNEQVLRLVSVEVLSQYVKSLGDKPICAYDVVYWCGVFSAVWDPRDMSLGGSEQAVVELSAQFANRGMKVAVYGEFKDDVLDYMGVKYMKACAFNVHQVFNTLIVWRGYGGLPIFRSGVRIQARDIFFDIHDNNRNEYLMNYECLHRMEGNVKIMAKSEYHKQCIVETCARVMGVFAPHMICVVMNGIRDKFGVCPPMTPSRNTFRFCYTSCYTRGLDDILRNFWPILKRLEPRCELHLYYGTDNIKDPAGVQYIKTLIANSQGVSDHGKQNMDMIIREKYMSNFHLYLSDSDRETDCIAVRESLVAGCIPIILNANVFKERDGLRVGIEEPVIKRILKVCELLRDSSKCEEFRSRLMASKTIVYWDQVAEAWCAGVRHGVPPPYDGRSCAPPLEIFKK